ncbi:hypothetical protein HDV00_004049 [Rhizophlyctis rosea]|nr:hypothetical protein HDV00_004049 [Rhizophlyctis rosea]
MRPVCLYWKKGNCRKGKYCPFLHEYPHGQDEDGGEPAPQENPQPPQRAQPQPVPADNPTSDDTSSSSTALVKARKNRRTKETPASSAASVIDALPQEYPALHVAAPLESSSTPFEVVRWHKNLAEHFASSRLVAFPPPQQAPPTSTRPHSPTPTTAPTPGTDLHKRYFWRSFVRKYGRPLEDGHQIQEFLESVAYFMASTQSAEGLEELIIRLGDAGGEGVKRVVQILRFPAVVEVEKGGEGGREALSFQDGVCLFLRVLSDRGFTQSTLRPYTNTIYQAVIDHAEQFLILNVLCNFQILWQLRGDLQNANQTITTFLLSSSRLIYELLTRNKYAIYDTTIQTFVDELSPIAVQWMFDDPTATTPAQKEHHRSIEREFQRIVLLVREGRKTLEFDSLLAPENAHTMEMHRVKVNSTLYQVWEFKLYDPPGDLSELGPRHANDKVDFTEIDIVPIMEEILSPRGPFLPTRSSTAAPHFLPHGAKRYMDTHFRLLREDMVHPIREGLLSFLRALNISSVRVSNLVKDGKFTSRKSDVSGLTVYSGVRISGFSALRVDKRFGVVLDVTFTPMPYPREFREQKGRMEFWKRSKRLKFGSLVCVLLHTGGGERKEDEAVWSHDVVLAVVQGRRLDDLGEKEDESTITLKIIESRFIQPLLSRLSVGRRAIHTHPPSYLLESSSVYFEAYRPILRTLQTFNPFTLPFQKYLAPNDPDNLPKKIDPPFFARGEDFSWDLSVLCKDGGECEFRPGDEDSRRGVMERLEKESDLDEGQVKAVLDCLEREVALVQGPPGTDKTYLGTSLIQILLSARHTPHTRPILCICETNHALDQFLEHLLDLHIRIVRIGFRSKSHRVNEYQLDEVVKFNEACVSVRQALKQKFLERDEIAMEVGRVGVLVDSVELEWGNVEGVVMEGCWAQWEAFRCVRDGNEGTIRIGEERDVIKRWMMGLDAIDPEEEMRQSHVRNPFSVLEWGVVWGVDSGDEVDGGAERGENYYDSDRNRPLSLLLTDPNPYQMSRHERLTLHNHWRQTLTNQSLAHLDALSSQLQSLTHEIDALHNESRRIVLDNVDVIGVTTHGAAKHTELLRSVGCKVVVCEEAGEVLEARVVSNLTSGTEHLILIGDPEQLRPSVATWKLSTDSPTGKSYLLDQSLLERLSSSFPTSHLTTQRRMRPEISDLIRRTLYPHLIDAENVERYPDVRGMQDNVFWFDHEFKERSGGSVAIMSHANVEEAEMCVGLVRYLIRNGYRGGDIAVLTPYLGQLLLLRDLLKESFTVVLDERDADEVERTLGQTVDQSDWIPTSDAEGGETSFGAWRAAGQSGREVSLHDQIVLRTVDNYQGEESKIVILSLVRNVGTNRQSVDDASVGFLGSSNRTNVMLSRAQEGMYILGNASLMEKKGGAMWDGVVGCMRERGQVGRGFRVVCGRHGRKGVVTGVGEWEGVVPDGGCMAVCGGVLKCGHEW